MTFQIGDQVVHTRYGIGELIQKDEKKLDGCTLQYYVVKVNTLLIWVPVNKAEENSLRYPTSKSDFETLFPILSGPAETLSNDHTRRRMEFTEQLKDGKLESFCRAVRDLTYLSRTKKLNDHDRATMDRAQNFLLREWAYTLSVSVAQASLQLNELLDEMPAASPKPVRS